MMLIGMLILVIIHKVFVIIRHLLMIVIGVMNHMVLYARLRYMVSVVMMLPSVQVHCIVVHKHVILIMIHSAFTLRYLAKIMVPVGTVRNLTRQIRIRQKIWVIMKHLWLQMARVEWMVVVDHGMF